MAQETIESIRRAELAAEQAEKDARLQAEEIVAKAHKDARELMESMTREARGKALTALEETGIKSDAQMSEALRQGEQEVRKLGEAVSAQESQAVKMILSELI